MVSHFYAFAIATSVLAQVINSSVVKASTEEDSQRLVHYGMGWGVAITLCDLVENDAISKTGGDLFVSNFRGGFENQIDNQPMEYLRKQSVKDGFNDGVKQVPGCSLIY